MVVRRDTNKEPKNQSDIDNTSDSNEEDLEFLIDGLLGNLSLNASRTQNMTIKKRKDTSKHERTDRITDVETSVPTQGAGIKRRSNRKNKSKGRKVTSSSSSSNKDRNWSSHRETPPNRHSRLNDCQADIVEIATGNNSEDEYCRAENVQLDDHGLEQLLKEKKGWKVIHVRGDGACLFRSVAHQVFGDEEKHDVIRKQVIDYLRKNREHYSQYVTEDFDRYLIRKSSAACFGNHLEIQAIAEIYNRPVEIYYKTVNPINVFHSEYTGLVPFRLAYYDSSHYNSVIDPCKPSFGHGLGMPNYQPGLPENDLVKQAILESEATEIEETMLRDKLAESETKQLEDCIAEHVLRESLLEHIKVQSTDLQRLSPQPRMSPPSPTAVLTWRTEPLTTNRTPPISTTQAACSSSSAAAPVANPSCSTSSTAAGPRTVMEPFLASSSANGTVGPSAIPSDPSAVDFTVLQYIPANMLGVLLCLLILLVRY
ncbi:unnamed protein product [Hymenolepis diminuta]|uniref:ubiquitinyl hydrolase 1 n=1 Tax=Hymenolepis diminuta TaxID=6216 RepID=A0A564XY36_HYMDI|nr:unnamed protein product [Hymenolepis diminuta]